MSNITTQPTSPAPAPAVPLERLVPYRRQINYALLAVGVAFLLIPVVLVIRQGLAQAFGPVFLWGAAVGLVNVAIAVLGLGLQTESEMTEGDKLRLQLLAVGGLVGFFTAVLGFVLPFTTYRETIAKGLEAWRETPSAIIYPGLAQIGGLALMFVSLQLGRGLERRSQAVRRLIYGYNAVLMTLLLLDVLALPNLLAYAEPFTTFFGKTYDWAKDEYNTVSPQLVNYLAEMTQPVEVTLIANPNNMITQDMQTLLDSCRSLSGKFRWRLIANTRENEETIRELMKRHTLSDPIGMLVTVGDPDKGAGTEFVRFNDLYRTSGGGMMGGGEQKLEFLGENALLNAMRSITEGNVVVYFTQNHGELEVSDGPPMGMRGKAADSASNLRGRLARKNFEIKPLKLDRKTAKIPDDATTVVIARPTQEFTAAEVKVLRDYLQRPEEKDKAGKVTRPAGKLMVLLDPVLQPEGNKTVMARTGLEDLLAKEYNVRVGDDRVITVHPQLRDPLELIALANAGSANPIARAWAPTSRRITRFPMRDVRTVDPAAEKGPKTVERLLLVPRSLGLVVLSGANLGVNPAQYKAALLQDEDRLDKALSEKDVCVAVAVSDSSAPPGVPRDRDHGALLKDRPRMVVFGCASWISDEQIKPGSGATETDLFNSCLAWLREAAGQGETIPSKVRGEYRPNLPLEEGNRVAFLPLGLMLLGVVSLATGVWVVRRR